MNVAIVDINTSEVINTIVVSDIDDTTIPLLQSEYPNCLYIEINENTGLTSSSSSTVFEKWDGLKFYKEYLDGKEPEVFR
jgi:hypothetical protein